MESTRWKFTWNDFLKTVVLLLISNLAALIMSLPEDGLPTWMAIKSNLISSLKFGVLPYALKLIGSDEVKAAKSVLAKVEEKQKAAAPNDQELNK